MSAINILRFIPKHYRVFWFAKILTVISPIILLGWLLNQNFFLLPTLSYHFRPNSLGKNIKLEQRSDLVATLGKNNKLLWRLNDDHLRFTVKIPRAYKSAKLTLNLNNETQQVVTLSAQPPPNISASPVLADFEFLNTLNWNRVSDGTTTLWWREKIETGKQNAESLVRKYTSIEEFEKNPPLTQTVGIVNLNPDVMTRVPNYQPSTTPITINHAFRGSHSIEFYAQNETVDIRFEKIDLNRKHNLDELTYRLTYAGKVVLKGSVSDDGVINGSGDVSEPVPVSIYLANAETGLYHLELTASEDVLFRNIRSMQPYFSFKGHVFLADGPAYYPGSSFTPLTLFATPGTLSVDTAHREGLQTVTVGTKKIQIKTQKQPTTFTLLDTSTKLEVQRGDISLAASYLSVDPAKSIGSNMPIELPLVIKPSLENIDYIFARYQPRETYGPLTIMSEFQASELFVKSKMLTFTLNAPGLEENNRVLQIDSINVKLVRGPIPWAKAWSKIWSGIGDLWK